MNIKSGFLIFTLLVFFQPLGQATSPDLRGFFTESSSRQRELEKRYESYLRRDNLRRWMKRLSARPHHVGSPYGEENAQFIASLFRSWGYDTRIEEFQILFPTPKFRRLELVEPVRFEAVLSEPPLPEDATSQQQSDQLPPYNAYSADGDVVGELVYVNYGVPEDYEELERHGISVEGKIVIARYGRSWRGIKPKVAAEHGAVACILYSDPRDDGYFQGDPYPEGPFRNENGVQRGSVADMPLYPGDPLTPGVGATENAHRLEISEARTLSKIPVLPISHRDALPFLKALSGPVAPQDWRGALPVTYHLGPGPARVHLEIEFNWDLVTAFNVIAKIEGSERPDQWIIRGNHHDAWVNGAEDPVSGMVALLEEARAVGELLRTGWKPRRTVVYAAWDAEEPGLLGSTEWVETHATTLAQKGVVYINTDSNGRGFLRVGGSHTLERVVNQVASDVVDPQTGVSVAERLRSRRIVEGSSDERQDVRDRKDLRIQALGSGSDYTPFLQHAGIASVNISYGGEDEGGSYHSVYDSFEHYTRFVDPDFDYGIALVETCGRLVLRLANADILPFEFENFADTIRLYTDEIFDLTERMREETEETNRLLKENRLQIVADPTRTYIPPRPKASVPYLNLAPLNNALRRVTESARGYERALEEASTGSMSLATMRSLDEILYGSERVLTLEEGLPERSWYKHFIYAPGLYTGYGVKTLPAVREAVEQRRWDTVDPAVASTAEVLERFADRIDKAIEVLEKSAK